MKQPYIIPEWFWEEKRIKEWLTFIPEETRQIWEDAKFSNEYAPALDQTCSFSTCIAEFFKWSLTPQGHDYWEAIVEVFRKLEPVWRETGFKSSPSVSDTEASRLDSVFKKDILPNLSSTPIENKNDCSFDILGI